MRRVFASIVVMTAALVCAVLAGSGLRTVAAQDAANRENRDQTPVLEGAADGELARF